MLTSIYGDALWLTALDCLAIACLVGVGALVLHLLRDAWRDFRRDWK